MNSPLLFTIGNEISTNYESHGKSNTELWRSPWLIHPFVLVRAVPKVRADDALSWVEQEEGAR